MKLLSTNRNAKGKQLVCEDAVFDPNLIMTLHVDAEERVVSFSYDFDECGHPLNLPFDVQSVDFLVKFTNNVYDKLHCVVVARYNFVYVRLSQNEVAHGLSGSVEHLLIGAQISHCDTLIAVVQQPLNLGDCVHVDT